MNAQSKTLRFHYDGVEFEFEIHADEHIISDTIETTGVWEENQLSLYKSMIPVGGVFVDIGANVGVNSIFAKMSVPAATVIAVEPEPTNFSMLKRNIEGLRLDIDLRNIAIADKPGSMGFSGAGTNAHFATGEGSVMVQCETLNRLTADLEHIDLLKIDVEGYTDLVLSRAAEALSRTEAAIIEFSRGDIENRFGTDRLTDIIAHSEQLFDRIRPYFNHFYYISRYDGLVALRDTADLFPIMFMESPVGDVLATRTRLPAMSDISFAYKYILDLRHQNHRRMVEIQQLGGGR